MNTPGLVCISCYIVQCIKHYCSVYCTLQCFVSCPTCLTLLSDVLSSLSHFNGLPIQPQFLDHQPTHLMLSDATPFCLFYDVLIYCAYDCTALIALFKSVHVSVYHVPRFFLPLTLSTLTMPHPSLAQRYATNPRSLDTSCPACPMPGGASPMP